MHGEVDFSESTPTKHLTNPVEGDVSDRWLLSHRKGPIDFLHDVSNLLRSWAELVELVLGIESLLSPDDLAIKGLFIDI